MSAPGNLDSLTGGVSWCRDDRVASTRRSRAPPAGEGAPGFTFSSMAYFAMSAMAVRSGRTSWAWLRRSSRADVLHPLRDHGARAPATCRGHGEASCDQAACRLGIRAQGPLIGRESYVGNRHIAPEHHPRERPPPVPRVPTGAVRTVAGRTGDVRFDRGSTIGSRLRLDAEHLGMRRARRALNRAAW